MFVVNALVDLLAVNRDILGRANANANLISFNAQHGDRNVIADLDRLANPARQYEHVILSVSRLNCELLIRRKDSIIHIYKYVDKRMWSF